MSKFSFLNCESDIYFVLLLFPFPSKFIILDFTKNKLLKPFFVFVESGNFTLLWDLTISRNLQDQKVQIGV